MCMFGNSLTTEGFTTWLLIWGQFYQSKVKQADGWAESPVIDSNGRAPLNFGYILDLRALLSVLRSNFILFWDKSLDLTHWWHGEAGDEYYMLGFYLENQAIIQLWLSLQLLAARRYCKTMTQYKLIVMHWFYTCNLQKFISIEQDCKSTGWPGACWLFDRTVVCSYQQGHLRCHRTLRTASACDPLDVCQVTWNWYLLVFKRRSKISKKCSVTMLRLKLVG